MLYNRLTFKKKGNKDNMLRRNVSLVQGALLALFMSVLVVPYGCAQTEQGLSAQQAAALEQRVRQRWQALSEMDYGKAWEYSTPVYRSVFPKELYVLQFSYAVERELTGIEVLNYDASAAVASVAARVMSKPTKLTSTASKAAGAIPVTIREKWIFTEGEWWYSANY